MQVRQANKHNLLTYNINGPNKESTIGADDYFLLFDSYKIKWNNYIGKMIIDSNGKISFAIKKFIHSHSNKILCTYVK